MYVNLTEITLLNLNHFWIAQAESCLKGTFVKVSFMFVTIFFSDIYENPGRKNFINLFCPPPLFHFELILNLYWLG